MTDRKPILVVYHGECTDGFTAAWAAWKKLGDSAEYVPAQYRPTDVFDVDGREVYILDYCPTRVALEDYAKRASKLTVIDHHQSAEDICKGLDFCIFDMKRSGAGMAWDYFHGTPRPALVDHVEDRDIWKWTVPRSRTVTAAIFSYPLGDFELWSWLADKIELDLPSILLIGEALERADTKSVQSSKDNVSLRRFAGYADVPVVNASGVNISELLNQLAPEDYFAVGWYQRANGSFKYSVRSKGTFDCAKLSERFGGGGHKLAAAFVSSLPPWDLRELPAKSS
jgi:oligoribonuclease NrnB/cAMP/cGMP phosphodiesterase (DHH superfamily)